MATFNQEKQKVEAQINVKTNTYRDGKRECWVSAAKFMEGKTVKKVTDHKPGLTILFTDGAEIDLGYPHK